MLLELHKQVFKVHSHEQAKRGLLRTITALSYLTAISVPKKNASVYNNNGMLVFRTLEDA